MPSSARQQPSPALVDSPRLKIMLVAFSARNAIQQTLDAMFAGIGPLVDYRAMLPTHYAGQIPETNILRIACGTTKQEGALASFNPVSHWQIVSAFRRFRPDLVHIYAGEGYPWAATLAMAAKIARVPLVVTLNDPDPHPGSVVERMNAWIRKPVIASASAIHLYSASHLKQVEAMLPGKPITVIEHGSLAEQFLVHRRPDIPRERLILFFGRIEYYKGIDVLCQAVLALPADIRLAIAGPGTLRPEELALTEKLGDRVEIHNAMLDESQVARLMQRASVMALPYRHVTQSSVPAIAASFGLPIVASALGHFVEEIPLLHGTLVPPEDPDSLAVALSAALAAPPARIPPPSTFADLAPRFLALYRSTLADLQRSAER